MEFDLSGSFDSESDACLTSLRDLFLSRVNRNRERRMRMNENHAMLRVSRVTWLTVIFPYMSLEDCLRLGQTCLYFS